MRKTKPEAPAPEAGNPMSRHVGNASFIFGSMLIIKLFDLATLAVASRMLSLKDVGLYFLAEAAATMTLAAADMGLWSVVTRRVARGQLGMQALKSAMLLRAVAVAGVILVASGLWLWLSDPGSQPWAFIGFAIAWSLAKIHEVSRATLTGQERFALNASIGVVARMVGTAVSVAGLFLGGGVMLWVCGRVLAETIQGVASTVFARRFLQESPRKNTGNEGQPSAGELVSEGLPFWGRLALDSLGGHIEVVTLTAALNIESAAVYGLSGRVMGAGLMLVSSMTGVLFPSFSRKNGAPITSMQVLAVMGAAAAVALTTGVVAPPILEWWVLEWSSEATSLLHLMAFSVLFLAVYDAGAMWLIANDQEAGVLKTNMVAHPVALALVSPLVAALGPVGAVGAQLARNAVQALGVMVLARKLSKSYGPHRSGHEAD